ncbi:MAG: lipocalin family protein [Verrucomicrobiales bacterium]
MKTRFTTSLLAVVCLSTLAAKAEPGPLPSPAEFEPTRYLGKWFEVARLPIASQPEGSLAIAEYTAGDEPGTVTVKNSAYDGGGKFIGAIEGKAEIVEGEAKGRLKVGFGPAVPAEANYCVLSIHPKYRFAVVGSPDRKAMWILSRRVPIGKKKLEQLAAVAGEAGFDISKLVYNKWPKEFAKPSGKKKAANRSKLAGEWTFQIDGPDGQVVELPMELAVEDQSLSGRIGRGDGRWFELKDGKVDGDSFQFSIVRDRPQGGTMTYQISGKLVGDGIGGEAKADVDGQQVTQEWEAVRVAGKIEKPKITGDWVLHLPNPDGGEFDLPMELEVDGDTIRGRIGRGDGRWLTVKDGKVDGNTIEFAIERDRESGGSITYQMAGKYAEGKLTGTTKANFEGRGEITSKWHADRKD